MPKELKTKFCKNCNAFLLKGKNAEITKQGSLTIVKCLVCGFERKTGEKQ
jgi:RNase P subunit RPR2